ncbi:hypothetical protein [Rhodococcus sp. SORGH_AS_0303]|uniref:5-methylcytosine restriction system specificity protein McrC n=1 Tax=Rhodococcus sp. SORGH_AS_0303 TaxID=3041753 RepID=UPI002787014E|nr:hypothetical protein [Rhodococcus sp. SORGH_AS_0303]MDQ1200493.1 5-methylcytosine-specific restriction enzyme subunit McrC [Rhodococcus sp. SORGH_AS_0303]
MVFQELRSRPGTTEDIAAHSGISEGEVLMQLRELNDRVRTLLGYEEDPITVSGAGSWKADGVAGLLRLNPRVELEVVPKFLDPSTGSWRRDFFLLAVLVKTGHLLLHDEISAAADELGDLATLVAQSLLRLCAENERRPIRSYRRSWRTDFAIDGDVAWETVYLPDADGFSVSRLELSRQNQYNAVLAASVRTLTPEVADADTESQLRLLGRLIGQQPKPATDLESLPPRHQSWKQPYELARMIVDGMGLNLDRGTFTGPGFILSTWSAWEYLCEEVVRRALPNHQVVGQKQWALGHRGSQTVYVKPDISPMTGGAAQFLLDAKYKTRLGRAPRISAGDLYESLAFLNAAGASKMLLLYPSLHSLDDSPLGAWRRFDEVKVDGLTVEGLEIQVQGLARRGGFNALVSGARKAIHPAADTSQ